MEDSFHEEAFINALIKIQSDVRHHICFTQGHQELDFEDTYTPQGIGLIMTKITGQNYNIQPTNLMKEGRVPEFCEVLVVAGPRADFFPPEYEMIAQHVSEGRHLFVMLDPAASHPLACRFRKIWGILEMISFWSKIQSTTCLVEIFRIFFWIRIPSKYIQLYKIFLW